MPTLLEKIQASAKQRLDLPPGRHPKEEIQRYRDFLKVETHRLRILHRAGAGGRIICRARAAVLDALLQHIFGALRPLYFAGVEATRHPMAFVATGGYGRGELNPCSDIDLMVLHDASLVTGNRAQPMFKEFMEELLMTLVDARLKLGHAVRTVEDCVKVANEDMQSKTSLIEARWVAGDQALVQRLQSVVVARCVREHEDEYIAARIEDQNTRRTKYGNSACMQEPNIKNGCGGLRDVQNLVWMAFFKYRAHSLAELEERGQLSASEHKQLEAAYDFLLRTRNEIHYITGRAVDVLQKNLQPSVAHNLGYTDRSPVKRIEAFMHDLYTHLRNVYIITRNLEQNLALVPPAPKRLQMLRGLLPGNWKPAPEQIVDGFKITTDAIHPTSSRVFRDQPRRLMRVFLLSQQRGLKLHPDLVQQIRNQLHLVDRSFLMDEHVSESFREILSQRGNVVPTLRAMHEAGFLGKYMPEFGKLTCLVQHEFFHQYAADEHTLMCIEKLDQVWGAQQKPGSDYTELFARIERPFLLYLAVLLHDTGKALHDNKHSDASGRIAIAVAKRLGLDGALTHSLRLVIEQHLTMVQISQRRDLDDPSVIRNFAALIQTRENLDMLTIHTYVDSLGTADNLWNGFKDSLLWSLHRKTAEFLAGGTEFVRAEAKQRQLLADEVRALLPKTFGKDEIEAHFAGLPPRYFVIHSSRDISGDLTRVHRFLHLQVSGSPDALVPIVTWHNEPDRGYAAVNICTWDRNGLFSKIAGSLTAAGLNILGAAIFSRNDGIILDTFYVIDAQTGALPKREEREKFEQYLTSLLTGDFDVDKLIAKQSRRSIYHLAELAPIPTQIHFDNETSESRTVIDIEAEDRVGLLYGISRALAEMGIDISLAKISTEKGAAIDSFYVAELDGNKITSPERMHFVEGRLRATITGLSVPTRA